MIDLLPTARARLDWKSSCAPPTVSSRRLSLVAVCFSLWLLDAPSLSRGPGEVVEVISAHALDE